MNSYRPVEFFHQVPYEDDKMAYLTIPLEIQPNHQENTDT